MIAFLAFFAGIDLGGLGTARGELKGSSPNGSEDWGHAVGQWIATNNAANVGIRTRIEATRKERKRGGVCLFESSHEFESNASIFAVLDIPSVIERTPDEGVVGWPELGVEFRAVIEPIRSLPIGFGRRITDSSTKTELAAAFLRLAAKHHHDVMVVSPSHHTEFGKAVARQSLPAIA